MTADSSKLVRLDSADANAAISKPLFGLARAALSAIMVAAGEPAWRGHQLAEALYSQQVADLSEITTLPKRLRAKLQAEGWTVGRPRLAQVFQSADGTERYLVDCQSEAAQTVEAVWMPEGDDGESGDGSESAEEAEAEAEADLPTQQGAPSIPRPSAEWVGDHEPQSPHRPTPQTLGNHASHPAPTPPDQDRPRHRATICVSSQVGCAVNCQFCLTAKLGLQRNLTPGEIAGQVVSIFERHRVQVGRDRVNLVFMGMGEPFLNYSNFMAAVRLLVTEVGLSPQRMTVSTSGIVPGIESFAQEPPELRPKLAISLNAPNDQIRSRIMPINRKWPIEAVIDAARQVRLRPRERITFEYVLLGGVTDQPQHAREVARLIRRTGLPAKVNLIAWNPGPGIPYTMPHPETVETFRATLAAEGIPTYLRRPRGRDIFAACGQLKRTVEG